MPIVTLLTDYGARDYYVAAVKGVILGLAPRTTIVDITHEVEAHSIVQGAFVLWQAFPWFPAGTIHVAVVDPGVGTARRIVLAGYAGQIVLAPDNGLLTFLHREYPLEMLRAVENRRLFVGSISATFHGRDILAPVAAHLANGARPWEVGPELDRLEMLEVSHRAKEEPGRLVGEALYVDRFGNIVTNVHADQLGGVGIRGRERQVTVNGQSLGSLRTTYGDVAPGGALAYVGGSRLVEIGVHGGRAVDRFGPRERISIEIR